MPSDRPNGIRDSSNGSVQCSSLSWVRLFATPWTTARRAFLSITNSWSLPKLMRIESVMPSNHIILCRPLLRLSSIFPSIRGFSNESALRIRRPKFWSFSFNISPSNEFPGLISFRTDWLDLLAVQGTLKSLLQYHSSKASILRHSAFFTVQLSHPYDVMWKILEKPQPWLEEPLLTMYVFNIANHHNVLTQFKCLTFLFVNCMSIKLKEKKNKTLSSWGCQLFRVASHWGIETELHPPAPVLLFYLPHLHAHFFTCFNS